MSEYEQNLPPASCTRGDADGNRESGNQSEPALTPANERVSSAGNNAIGANSSAKPRRREEIQRERQVLVEKTENEIAQIAAEFQRVLPGEKATTIGAIYARYSSRHQDSIADQVRKCYEAAVREGIFVPREFVHFDLAVRGYKQQRAGLNLLRDLLDKKRVQAVICFATNRLFRKT